LRIAILTQYYPPEIGAPQARLSHLAGEFARRGHDVTVLTAMPNYPRGRVYPGYGGLLRRERQDGVTVIRSWIFPTQSVGRVRRLLNYFSFVASALVAGVWTLGRLDYLLTESPPLFLGMTGYLLARKTGARWIFNVSDLWPESAVRLGVIGQGWSLRAAEALEAFCYRKAWLVTGQSRGILQDISRRFPSVALYHLSNGVDTTAFDPGLRSPETRRRFLDGADDAASCLAIYAGLHGIAQGLDQILDAAALVKSERLRIVFVGDGPEKARLAQRGGRGVQFVDPLGHAEMPALMASADVALVPLKITLPGAVPSKLYEAMGSGAPVLLVADGEAAAIVREARAGMVVEPGDVAGLAEALEKFAEDPGLRRGMGAAGRSTAIAQFDRNAIAERFIGHLEGAAC
jgi:glycosyltransferase involved in cell wall biosynthesis